MSPAALCAQDRRDRAEPAWLPEGRVSSPPWLASILEGCAEFEGCDVDRIDVQPLGKGRGFASEIARIQFTGPCPPGAPRSLILKLVSREDRTREFVTGLGAYDREVRFYRELAPRAGIPVPRCYFAETWPDGRVVLLLEDLAPAEEGDQIRGASLERHERVLRAMAAMHARWWNDRDLLDQSWLRPPFDADQILELYRSSLALFCEQFGPLYPNLERVARSLLPMMQAFGVPIEPRAPFTLVHADLRLDNVFFPSPAGGRFGIVDWQTLSIGSASLDVGGWLHLSLAIDQRRAHRQKLLELYHAALLEGGVRGYPLWVLRVELVFVSLFQVMVAVMASGQLQPPAGRGEQLVYTTAERLEALLEDLRVARWLPVLVGMARLVRRLRRLRSRRSDPR